MTKTTTSLTVRFVVALVLGLQASPGRTGGTETLEGVWLVIDDHSGIPEALVRIENHAGQYEGMVIKLLDRSDAEPDPKCDKCTDDLKNAPIVGLTILRRLRRQGDEFRDGELLDPETGNVYHCYGKLKADANVLELRGYVGIPLLGRTQTWQRDTTTEHR